MFRKIIIVEDNEDMQFLYARMFRNKASIELTQVDTAEAALEIMPQLNAHLALIDISLPGMSGIELSKLVREQYPSIKILVVTGHETSRYYDEAINNGADDLVSKGIGKKIVDKCEELLPNR